MTDPRIDPVREATVEAYEPDPFRIEIKENSKGEPSVSVRATADDPYDAVKVATTMYRATRQELGLD